MTKKRRRLPSPTDQAVASKDGPPHDIRWEDAAWRGKVRQRLLAWFDQHARFLPWRSEPTPYHVWISEIMCQQTQVGTVLPYFQRFLKAYPTIKQLSEAREQDLMKLWEGLGYYRRARSLHAAAKHIVEKHGGKFPEAFDDVLALPGIGRYTAGAILSISRNQRLPILEGNTQRVFSRWIALQSPPTESSANRLLWQVAEKMLPRLRCGDFNQGAMELGALICKPKQPLCDQCPVSSHCAAFQQGLQEKIPGKISQVAYQDRDEFALVIRNDRGHYLMRELPDGARWAGLWDFPRPTDTSVKDLNEAVDWLSQKLDAPISLGSRLTTIRHAVTKYRIRLDVHHASLDPVEAWKTNGEWKFISVGQMKELPLSVTGRRIAKLLATDRQQQLALE